MMQVDLVSACSGFVMGTAVGAAGGYFASKFTDRRRAKEADKAERNKFAALAAQMPDVIADIAAMFENKATLTEFCVLSGDALYFPEFNLSGAKHEDLKSKVHRLESAGYVLDVSNPDKDISKYRMTEEFVQFVKRGRKSG